MSQAFHFLYSFDPQALTSLTLHRLSNCRCNRSFDPQALTSLTKDCYTSINIEKFRSTGSYEPDRFQGSTTQLVIGFRSTGSYEPDLVKLTGSDRLSSFDPQALTSLTPSV